MHKKHLFATMQANELANGYSRREFSPVEVVAETLGRIDALNGTLNAFYQIDHEEARESARASELRWLNGMQLSQLDGVPTSIKDALPSLGHQSFRGSAAHAETVAAAEYDAPVVMRMREAGMVFLGKTTMPDFGILPGSVSSKHGVTRNPWDNEFSAGGSSAGAACSIAAGLNPLAIGTDIVGSIRLPASFCGIFGFKPSQGRVPYYYPNSASLVAGPMARSVQDAALLLNVVVREDDRDFTAMKPEIVDYSAAIKSQLVGTRIAVIEDLGFGVACDQQVRDQFRFAVQLLENAGLQVTRIKFEFTAHDLSVAELFYKVRCRAELRNYKTMRLAKTINEWTSDIDGVSAVEFQNASGHLQKMREMAARLIRGNDFLVLPTVPRPPFKAELPAFGFDELFSPWVNTFLFNLTEQPGSSVPCGATSQGLPVGMQIVGRRFDDIGVLRLSHLFECIAPWRSRLDSMTAALG